MAINFAWIKEHKTAVAGIFLGVVVFIYIARKGGSKGSSALGVLQSAQAGQLQMAQLNAQLAAQGDQTNAHLESERIAADAQAAHDRDAAASQIALYGLQGHLYEDAMKAQEAEQAALLPLETDLVHTRGLAGHDRLQQTIQNELALLLTQGRAAGSLPGVVGEGTSQGFSLSIPGIGSLGVHV